MPKTPIREPMLSRRERKKLDTRRRILKAAMDLMSARSFDDVKIEEICEAADIANATFFVHFPTKAALISAFNEQIAEKVIERLAEFDVGAVEKLELLRAVILEEWRSEAALMRRFVGEVTSQRGGGISMIEASQSLIDLTAQIIKGGQESGEFSRQATPDVAALTIISAWTAIGSKWAEDGDGEAARVANREALDLVLMGLTPR